MRRRRVVLPAGQLRRLRLPEQTAEETQRRSRKRWLKVVVVPAWVLLSLWLWQWSIGRPSVHQWLQPLSGLWAEQEVTEPSELPRPAKESAEVRDQTPVASESEQPLAGLLKAPSQVVASRPSLPTHQGAWSAPLLEELEAPTTSLAGAGKARTVDTSKVTVGRNVAHWSGGCQRKYRKEEAPVTGGSPAMAERLQARVNYSGCKLPTQIAISLCATVRAGRVQGATVQTEPPNLYVAGCMAAAAGRLRFPKQRSQVMVRTQMFWR